MSEPIKVREVVEPQAVCGECGYAVYPSGYSAYPWCDSYYPHANGPVVHDERRCGYLRWSAIQAAAVQKAQAEKVAAARETREKVRRVVYYPFRLILKGFRRCRTSL